MDTQPKRSLVEILDHTAAFECRICHAKGNFSSYTALEMMYGSREPFDYVHCIACGCLQIRNIPRDLGRHYPADYYSQMPRIEPKQAAGLKGALMRWYCCSAVLRPKSKIEAVVRSHLPMPTDFAEYGQYLIEAGLQNKSDRILDVGCGASPHRLTAFQRCGFTKGQGVDPFISADCTYHGVPVYRCTIEQLNGEFEFIMFHHSLEHVPDPIATLSSAAKLLKLGGTCLVRIPVMNTYFWRHFGVNWAELDAPRHLYLMSLKTITVMAEATGFRIRKIQFDSEGWELASSYQYQAGIPMRGPNSTEAGPSRSTYTPDQMAAFELEAKALNKAGDAGRACFYLEKI